MRAAEEFLQEASGNNGDLLSLLREAVGLVSYYRRLLERFELDALTGLPGSNKFRDFTANLGSRAAGVGVVFFDVNDLKFYNDTKGHQAGDLLLQKASESILHIAGENAHAFRVGGDEFVMVITGCAEGDIEMLLAKWREKLAELNSVADGIHCSIAAGWAYSSGEDTFSDILKQADERMYAEKKRMKSAKSPELRGTR
jgi:diguanylate cyclase (GGDEF)-like protein